MWKIVKIMVIINIVLFFCAGIFIVNKNFYWRFYQDIACSDLSYDIKDDMFYNIANNIKCSSSNDDINGINYDKANIKVFQGCRKYETAYNYIEPGCNHDFLLFYDTNPIEIKLLCNNGSINIDVKNGEE